MIKFGGSFLKFGEDGFSDGLTLNRMFICIDDFEFNFVDNGSGDMANLIFT